MIPAGGDSGMSTSPEIHDFRAAAGRTFTSLDGKRRGAPEGERDSHRLFNRNNVFCFETDRAAGLWRGCG